MIQYSLEIFTLSTDKNKWLMVKFGGQVNLFVLNIFYNYLFFWIFVEILFTANKIHTTRFLFKNLTKNWTYRKTYIVLLFMYSRFIF